jgi:hypothetical protein
MMMKRKKIRRKKRRRRRKKRRSKRKKKRRRKRKRKRRRRLLLPQHSLSSLTSTTTSITITPRRETLVTKVSMKKFMVSLPMIDQFFHSHGEEQRKPTHRMDSRTQLSNGLIRNHWLREMAFNGQPTKMAWTMKLPNSVP